MKYCKDCKHAKIEYAPGPIGATHKMFLCTADECRDPVSGEPIPCGMARKDPVFCGITAKYYEKDEPKEVAPVVQLIKP